MSTSQGLEVGDTAPDFDLNAFPEGRIRLKDYRKKHNVLLYFYPRDNTPGCTTEACDFRDQSSEILATGTVILGLSTDSVESHRKFSEKFSLPFPLLADPDHHVAEKFGVWVEKSNYGKKYMGMQRSTFLIDKAGKIAAVWRNVKATGHVARVMEAVRDLK